MGTTKEHFQELATKTEQVGHDAIDHAITDLRKLADDLEHYKDAYGRAMAQHDYPAAEDHLWATQRVLNKLADDNGHRLSVAVSEVKITNGLWYEPWTETLSM